MHFIFYNIMKYPRTYHLPFSKGTTSDDRILKAGWFDNYKGREVVLTEKLDGENNCMTPYGVFARSHAAPTRNPWSRNLWDYGGLYEKVKGVIGPYEEVFGENLYGEHSIKYNRLSHYFHIFAVRGLSNEMFHFPVFYSWDDVCLVAEMMGVPTVPLLWRGVFDSEDEVEAKINELMSQPSTYGDEKEGVVMRIADEFYTDDFPKCVCKYVRANHVQTDEHWTKNWKKAELFRQ